jgi:hypothetical protein
MLCVLFVAVIVPVRLGFNFKDTKFSKYSSNIIDVTFLIDMILTFFTPYFDDDSQQIVTNHREIALTYLKSWFVLDLLSIFPFEQIFSKSIKLRQFASAT